MCIYTKSNYSRKNEGKAPRAPYYTVDRGARQYPYICPRLLCPDRDTFFSFFPLTISRSGTELPGLSRIGATAPVLFYISAVTFTFRYTASAHGQADRGMTSASYRSGCPRGGISPLRPSFRARARKRPACCRSSRPQILRRLSFRFRGLCLL